MEKQVRIMSVIEKRSVRLGRIEKKVRGGGGGLEERHELEEHREWKKQREEEKMRE